MPGLFDTDKNKVKNERQVEMRARKINDRVSLAGAVDWNRRLFDSLIPLPEGTSYNAYIVRGSEATALIDTADPAMASILKSQLEEVDRIDYVISQHAEQDHAGALPDVLALYPEAVVICSVKAKDMLIDHLHLPASRIRTVAEGETLSLGDCSLTFVYTPWVHWPETMCTYLPEDRILFSCDFFGSHLATSRMYAGEDPHVCEAAKRYYAEIMMPFRKIVKNNVAKVQKLDCALIAPSHGPIYDKPRMIIDAYVSWLSDTVANKVVIPYISMHGSTEIMVNHLIDSLARKGIEVQPFDLTVTDIGALAMALVDAATIIIGTPTVHFGPHPNVFAATHLANSLKPKVRYAAIIGSYGWGTQAVEQLSALIPNLKVEVLDAVMCKGLPREEDFEALDRLAEKIHEKHAALS